MLEQPVAVGGIGGSGTRIVAGILQDLGVFIGGDLSVALDNLWYALLFGRRDVLLDPEGTDRLIRLFFRQMSDPRPLDAEETTLIEALATQNRIQHGHEDLANWAESLTAHSRTGKPARAWGWKVPYTHVLIDRLLQADPELRYIHITRNGRDMAFSRNQNQLMKWGPVFLNRDVRGNPRDSLAFWCAVHRRMTRLSTAFPGRIHELDYDRLIRDPGAELEAMFAFLGIVPPAGQVARFRRRIVVPDTVGRGQAVGSETFAGADLAYLEQIGQAG